MQLSNNVCCYTSSNKWTTMAASDTLVRRRPQQLRRCYLLLPVRTSAAHLITVTWVAGESTLGVVALSCNPSSKNASATCAGSSCFKSTEWEQEVAAYVAEAVWWWAGGRSRQLVGSSQLPCSKHGGATRSGISSVMHVPRCTQLRPAAAAAGGAMRVCLGK